MFGSLSSAPWLRTSTRRRCRTRLKFSRLCTPTLISSLYRRSRSPSSTRRPAVLLVRPTTSLLPVTWMRFGIRTRLFSSIKIPSPVALRTRLVLWFRPRSPRALMFPSRREIFWPLRPPTRTALRMLWPRSTAIPTVLLPSPSWTPLSRPCRPILRLWLTNSSLVLMPIRMRRRLLARRRMSLTLASGMFLTSSRRAGVTFPRRTTTPPSMPEHTFSLSSTRLARVVRRGRRAMSTRRILSFSRRTPLRLSARGRTIPERRSTLRTWRSLLLTSPATTAF
mmetsp:Transcript_19169/g.55234  ORF Transcript_19169/g.55234 Transcript_19169/m.55234 type:complete len:280 (+) Transcript_19169:1364-2203(+)